jgi:hypothetical protein
MCGVQCVKGVAMSSQPNVPSPVRASAPEHAVDAAYAECMRNLTPAEAEAWNKHDYSVRWKWRAILLALDAAAEARGRQQAEQVIAALTEGSEAEVRAIIAMVAHLVDNADAVVLLRHVGAQAERIKELRERVQQAEQAREDAVESEQRQYDQSVEATVRMLQAEQALAQEKAAARNVAIVTSEQTSAEWSRIKVAEQRVAALTQALKDRDEEIARLNAQWEREQVAVERALNRVADQSHMDGYRDGRHDGSNE